MFYRISYESGSTQGKGRRREEGGGCARDQIDAEDEWKISPSGESERKREREKKKERERECAFLRRSRHPFVSWGNDLIAVSAAMHRCACYVITRINLIYYEDHARRRYENVLRFEMPQITVNWYLEIPRDVLYSPLGSREFFSRKLVENAHIGRFMMTQRIFCSLIQQNDSDHFVVVMNDHYHFIVLTFRWEI